MRAVILASGLGLAALGATTPARAHTMSDGHLILAVDGDRLTGTLDVPVRDLHDAIGLDPGGDGTIDWRDITARRDAIVGYALDRLTISSRAGRCELTAGRLGVVDRAAGAHVAVAVAARCREAPDELTVDYRLLHELDAQHRGLIRIGDGVAIARHRASIVRVTVRTGALARFAAAVPGGALALVILGAVLALGVTALRRHRGPPCATS